MAAGSRRYYARLLGLTFAIAVAVASTVTVVNAAETPRRGGVLLAVIGADPPSLDPHQESTFATIQLVAPLYSTLLQTDPYDYPKIIGDAASDWKTSPDGLTYTFKIRPGIKFHDGSPLTAVDVKATYDKLLNPPAGTRSVRKNSYSAITTVEAPDASTVVFKLKFPSASLLLNLASPWNVIYPKKYLDKDPNYFMKNVVGSGPFKFELRGRAQPRLLREGPAVPQRLQVLHQHGDVGAGGGDPLRARLHRVP
jgi:peptide/nickel transport system substrate-binding protein